MHMVKQSERHYFVREDWNLGSIVYSPSLGRWHAFDEAGAEMGHHVTKWGAAELLRPGKDKVHDFIVDSVGLCRDLRQSARTQLMDEMLTSARRKLEHLLDHSRQAFA